MIKRIQAQWLAMQAHVYIQQRKYERAITLLEAMRLLRPTDEHPLKALSFAYLQAGKPKQSIACINAIEKSAKAVTTHKKLQLIKSHAYWSLEQEHQAKRFMREYLASDCEKDISAQPST